MIGVVYREECKLVNDPMVRQGLTPSQQSLCKSPHANHEINRKTVRS